MAAETRLPRMRSSAPVRAARELRSAGRMDTLDLHVFSNCSLAHAELMVGRCVESDTQDFANSRPLLNHGCAPGNGTFEILTSISTVRIYRLYLGSLGIMGDTMYVECLVHLCVSTKQTQRCPDPCTETSDKTLVNSIQTHNYTIRSGPVRLMKATETSSTTARPSLTAVPVAKPSTSHTSSHTLDRGAFWVVAVSLAVRLLQFITD